ncbi:AraC family transcriptional regulator [Actinoplanes sp. TBRC 11911]|uniref:AraC family transcriptional regulator n=1 Tax=Actinoplanes sp. TBRC 11911 TaxID=2729386 RepID=UPI00145FAB43|nr:helix-turn-helix transcriptional regulator [Actinoplanes sp. TBRC 11911]NMO57002.1 AraC family transcriptional regulator [Actinoplanes sp. TBRC 11911]
MGTLETAPRVRLDSAEDVVEYCSQLLTRHTVEPLTTGQHLMAAIRNARVGSLVYSDVTYDADVRLAFSELGTYLVSVPLTGRIHYRHRNVDVDADTGLAAVCLPEDNVEVTRWEAGSRNAAFVLDRAAVDHALMKVTGGRTGTGFTPSIDLCTGRGRSFSELVRAFVRQLDDPHSLLRQPMVAMPYVEALVHGFLAVANSRYLRILERPARPAPPSAVHTALEIIHAEPETALTTAVLADRCHVAVRTLQEGFQRHLGSSPMAVLRSVRLARAHAELLDADPSTTTVATIAYRWAFGNLSRFAEQHRKAYGESPAETLHH